MEMTARARTLRGLLLATTTLAVLSASHAQAGSLPSGGTVTSGTAAITSPTSSQLTINQTSAKAIVTWSDFSIAQGNTVQFNNGSGSTLNRVTGSNASQIDGALNATGSVYLINQNGIVVGKTGVVNVGGSFVASTLDVPDASYLAGGSLTFSGASTASVLNLGQIGASGGDVALIAQTVENDGTITAPGGDVGLLAGSQVTLSDTLSINGKFQVTLGSGSSATNTGTIKAAIAELRAYGGNIYALAGNTGGSITATGVAANDGQVFLTANAASGATGVGDITITGGVSFSGGADALTIDAFHNASILTPISTTGGHVTLTTNDGGVGGDYSFGLGPNGFAGSLSFLGGAGSGESLTINGQSYTLIYTLADLQNMNGNLAGNYALATNLDASATSSWNLGAGFTPIGQYSIVFNPFFFQLNGTPFSGSFEGDGNKLSNLQINISGADVDQIPDQFATGLFSYSTGKIRDTGLSNINLQSANANAGALVGFNNGTILNSYATGVVDSPGTYEGGHVGGLVGWNFDNASILRSFAIDTVTGGYVVGGLAGENDGLIGSSYANGTVTFAGSPNLNPFYPGNSNFTGGLVGLNDGTIEFSYAAGAVQGGQRDSRAEAAAGGLVGYADGGAVIAESYSTGPVLGSEVGGLVGALNSTTAIISDSYSTGSVTGSSFVGGLVGSAYNGVIVFSYATGAVNDQSAMGGLLGYRTPDFSVIPNVIVFQSYWDADTSGKFIWAPGSGFPLSNSAMLHAANFAGFDFSATGPWRIVEGQSFPYLAWQFSGTPGVISGTVSSSLGGSPISAAAVTGYANGTALASTISGANGYYQILTAPGLLANADVVTFLPGATPSATALATGVTGTETGLNLVEGALTIQTGQTGQTSLSSLASNYVHALGGFTSPDLVWTPGTTLAVGLAPGASLLIDASGNFTVDQSLNLGAGALAINAGGAVSEASNAVVWAAGLSGSSVGGASWTSANNKVGRFGWTNSGAGGVTLDDGAAITLDAVDAGTGDLAIGGPLGYRIFATGPLSAGGNVSLSASHGIDISGQITAGGAVTLTGSSVGGVVEYGSGAISATSLGGTANMSILQGTNAVGAISGFSTTNGFLFNDTQALTVSGPITGGSGLLYLQTSSGGMTINGSLTSAGNMLLRANGDIAIDSDVNTGANLALYATGAVSETGTVTADTLLGYSNGSTNLSGANQINTLLGYRTYHGGSTLTLWDLVHLTVSAPVAAYAVSFTDPAGLSIGGFGIVATFGGGRTLNGVAF